MPPERSRRRRPACRECRYQKVKCDAEPPGACSRCRRMDLECVVASTPNARRTKSQLQRELDAIRHDRDDAAGAAGQGRAPAPGRGGQGQGRRRGNAEGGHHRRRHAEVPEDIVAGAADIDVTAAVTTAAAAATRHRTSSGPAGLPGAFAPASPATPVLPPAVGPPPLPLVAPPSHRHQPPPPLLPVSDLDPVLAPPGLADEALEHLVVAGGPTGPASGRGEQDSQQQRLTASGSSDHLSPVSMPQVMDGYQFSGRKIQDCFDIYFRYYAPFFPVLDPRATTPNGCYEQSPFLFWTIVYLGSSHYDNDPTLVGRLAPQLNAMAFSAIEARDHPIQTIQGILLLCLWPVPMSTMNRNIGHVLAGAALHMAMQIGLHVAGVGQDFARTILRKSRSEKIRRALLWKQCCVVSYSTGLAEGIMPLGLGDSVALPVQVEREVDRDPAGLYHEIKFRIKTSDMAICAIDALRRTQLENGAQGSSTMAACISLFDAQLTKLGQSAVTILDHVYLSCYRVNILAHNFLVDRAARKHDEFLTLHAVACRLIMHLCHHPTTASETEPPLIKHSPILFQRSVILAAFAILKIHRSEELRAHVDLEAGERAYFGAIVACRDSSVQNNDLGARGAAILGQLWNSRSVFQQPSDGAVDSLGCRIHTRMSMSVVYDCLWWWRQEFSGQGNPYAEDVQTRDSTPASDVGGIAGEQDGPGGQEQGDLGHAELGLGDPQRLFDEPFLDFDWTMGLNMGDWPM